MVKYFSSFFLLFCFSFAFWGEPDKLIFSNDPESFYYPGSLLNLQVSGDFRLFFSHCNRTGQKGRLYVEIVTTESEKFFLRSSLAGPNKSELYVGKVLGEHFLSNYQKLNEATSPLKREYMIADGDVLSGIMDVFPADKKKLYGTKIYFLKPSSIKTDTSKTVFTNKSISQRIKIKGNGVRNNLRIADPLDYLHNGYYFLKGNYGVFYEYLLEFSEIGDYQLLFTANGGPASCVFLLDDKMFSDYTDTHKDLGIINIKRPGIKKLMTFPLPGSNYPVTVTIVKKRVYTK